jgi:hypothetical protein
MAEKKQGDGEAEEGCLSFTSCDHGPFEICPVDLAPSWLSSPPNIVASNARASEVLGVHVWWFMRQEVSC